MFLVMSVRAITRRNLSWLVVAAAGCVVGCPSPRGRPPTNVILVSIDTLVPARMSAYGLARDTTPAAAAIAARGVRFTNAFSPAPWTLPAHAAMLTGRYPSSLAPDPNDRRLYQAAPLLAEVFRRAGYRTGAVAGGGFVSARFGADRGFESFASAGPPAAVRWVESHRQEPFFLFYHTYVVHAPYKDNRYVRAGAGGRLGGYPDPARRSFLHLALTRGAFQPTAEERDFLLALYDGGVKLADEGIATIWATVERLGLADRTAIVITSDHGEEFWQHTGRAAYHGHTLYDELLRIPLIWYEPGLAASSRTVDEPVSLIDIMPTLVARFGLEPPERVDGVDLSPLLDGRAWRVERGLFAEGVRHGPTRVSVRTAHGKLIQTLDDVQRGEGAQAPIPVAAPLELYLAEDRSERRNTAAEEDALAASLQALLEAHRGRAATAPPTGTLPALDEQARRQLQALGYDED